MPQLKSVLLACTAVLAVPVPFAAAQEAKPPETHTVAAGPLKITVSLDGVFEAEQMTEVILRPEEWSGLVVDKAVPQGTKVAAGDPILWLETDKLTDAIRDTEFALELGKLSLAGAELELRRLRVEDRCARDVRRQEVRRTLNAVERAADARRQSPGQHRFGDPRNILEQHVALAEQGHHRLDDFLPLADHDLFDAGDDALGRAGHIGHRSGFHAGELRRSSIVGRW